MSDVLSNATAGPLGGIRIGLLEGRMPEQLGDLIRRNGGVPVIAPALREVPTHDVPAVVGLIDSLTNGTIQIVVFLTGAGSTALFNAARELGRLSELVGGLQTTTNVCRGQKPWRPLKEAGVPISVTAPLPYTTTEMLHTLEQLSPAGKNVALIHYGERNEVLADSLTEWGASVRELLLYQWRLPEDTRPLDELIDAILDGRIDAMVFTSKVQVRHLLQIAERGKRADRLVERLNSTTIVAAVGPTSAAELEESGIHPKVVPTNPKMGPMILGLIDYMRTT